MYPLTIGLAVVSKQLREEVQECLEPTPCRIVIDHQDPTSLDGFIDRVDRMRPDVILLDISQRREPLDDLVRQIHASAAETMIIALNASADANVILASLRAGVNEYLFPPLRQNLFAALEKKSAEQGKRRDGVRTGGKVAGFFSAKGGCGATTLACHLAVELGRLGQKVLVADLDIDAGMIAFLMKAKSPYSILDAVNNLHRLDASYWKALVANGIPNVEIIPAPSGLAARAQFVQQQLRTVLGFLRSQYDWTITDLGRSLGRVTMDALEELDEAYLVTTLEVPALHMAKQITQTLLDSGYGKNRLRLILNRVPKRIEITAEELEKMLGLPVHSMIPNDYPELSECYSEGRLLPRNSNLGKHIQRVAMKLAGVEEDKAKKRFSLFG
ncbi:MAG: AAA family ATPase [Bryobacteraceae bacterium]